MDSDPVKAEQGELLGVEQDPDLRKRTSRACIRCRFRHTRCPGGQPCGKCQMAKTKCEYVEYEKRLVVSRKYLYKLQEDIVRLKKENAALRAANESNGSAMRPDRDASREKSPDVSADRSSEPQVSGDLDGQFLTPDDPSVPEVIHPSLDKHGRLIQSRTGEKLYVGSSSMTLFGLEIENMAPPYAPDLLHSNSLVLTPADRKSVV